MALGRSLPLALLLAPSTGCAERRECQDIALSSLAVRFQDAATGERLCPEVQMTIDEEASNSTSLTESCVLNGPMETVGSFKLSATLTGYEPLSVQIDVGTDECGMVPESRILRMQPLAAGDDAG